jgi:hypothetical protein
LGVGLTTLPCKKKIVEKPPRNSAGFCGGGQGLRWAVEPRKEEEEEEEEVRMKHELSLQFNDDRTNYFYSHMDRPITSTSIKNVSLEYALNEKIFIAKKD